MSSPNITWAIWCRDDSWTWRSLLCRFSSDPSGHRGSVSTSFVYSNIATYLIKGYPIYQEQQKVETIISLMQCIRLSGFWNWFDLWKSGLRIWGIFEFCIAKTGYCKDPQLDRRCCRLPVFHPGDTITLSECSNLCNGARTHYISLIRVLWCCLL